MVSEQEFLDSFPQVAPENSPSGHPGHLTPEQEKALAHLRDLLRMQGFEARLDDATLLRFLRARKFDVGKSHEMFVECEKWRESFGVNTILDDFWYEEKADVMKYYPQFYHKTDIDGRPVYYEILGGVDIHAMYKITSQERMLKNLVWEYESFSRYRLPASARKAGKLIETSCTIFDLKGVSLTTATQVYSYIREASTLSQNYYPERMGKFYVINAPWGFSTVWAAIKRFLDPVTVEKIHIYGHKYKSALLKQIPIENLPEQFGGESKTDVPLYMADSGPWRDPKYVGPEGMAPEFGSRPKNAVPRAEAEGSDAAATTTAAATA